MPDLTSFAEVALLLAMAAGIGLPLLAWMGYAPGAGGETLALSLAYAALPCALKLAAGLVVLLAPFPYESNRDPEESA